MRLTRHEQSAPALGGTPEQTPGGYFWHWRAMCKCLSQVDKVKCLWLDQRDLLRICWLAVFCSPEAQAFKSWHSYSFHLQNGRCHLIPLTSGPVRNMLPKSAPSPRDPLWQSTLHDTYICMWSSTYKYYVHWLCSRTNIHFIDILQRWYIWATIIHSSPLVISDSLQFYMHFCLSEKWGFPSFVRPKDLVQLSKDGSNGYFVLDDSPSARIWALKRCWPSHCRWDVSYTYLLIRHWWFWISFNLSTTSLKTTSMWHAIEYLTFH